MDFRMIGLQVAWFYSIVRIQCQSVPMDMDTGFWNTVDANQDTETRMWVKSRQPPEFMVDFQVTSLNDDAL